MVLNRKYRMTLTILVFVSLARGVFSQDKLPAPARLRICTAGNSFHVWMPDWLTQVEKSAGLTPHEQLHVSYMASAWVKQHWEATDEKHIARQIVESGHPDVLTLGGMHTPDEGIDKFAAAALEHSPRIIITYQEFWLPFDRLDYQRKNYFGDLTKSLRTWNDATDTTKTPKDTSNFNIPTADQLDKIHVPYFEGIDKYVDDLNGKLSRKVIRIVPVGQAVLALRRKVIAGEVPTIAKQSDLFVDNLGHPGDAIRAISAYCHYIVIYQKDPRGLRLASFPFIQRDNKFNQDCNLVLQQLAWEAVTNHPLSGFYKGQAN